MSSIAHFSCVLGGLAAFIFGVITVISGEANGIVTIVIGATVFLMGSVYDNVFRIPKIEEKLDEILEKLRQSDSKEQDD